MLGIESYGSDSDNDENLTLQPSNQIQAAKPKRPAKKIAIGLPPLSNLPPSNTNDDSKDGPSPAKKPRLASGAGASSLLSLLPAPKPRSLSSKPPERVLGAGRGPGLVFTTSPSFPAPAADKDGDEEYAPSVDHDEQAGDEDTLESSTKSFAFMPASVRKGKPNISVEDEGMPKSLPRTPKPPSAPGIDFFSLGSSSSSSSSKRTEPTPSTEVSLPVLSSAPEIPTFKPPTPTREDPYPGYYLLPSGAWAAYDPEYYNNFLKKWQKEYNDHVRSLEKGLAKGFEGADDESVAEVNAMKEMEKAKLEIQAREEKKAITKDAKGEPAKPRMNIDPAKLGGRAKSRHQLSSLLTEAYQNREALEDKIAEGRRNRKEAGNKYGF